MIRPNCFVVECLRRRAHHRNCALLSAARCLRRWALGFCSVEGTVEGLSSKSSKSPKKEGAGRARAFELRLSVTN